MPIRKKSPKTQIRSASGARPKAPGKSFRFPQAWEWFFDELLPDWVKTQYSPQESWKGKPFAKEDARFFFRGIEDLSELFTDERPDDIPPYFQHQKYRSSYLLYFLPLQAAKFCAIFEMHAEALRPLLEFKPDAARPIRIADLGAGPGTASIALLLWLFDQSKKGTTEFPQIEFYWCDTNGSILNDGKALIELIASQFPTLRGKITVKTSVQPWWKVSPSLPDSLDLILMGHVLNESPRGFFSSRDDSYYDESEEDAPQTVLNSRALQDLYKKLTVAPRHGSGILFVEPAARKPAQLLSKLRDSMLENTQIFEAGVWGPCLHSGNCPMSQGRDWCHFSAPAEVPGKWFKIFSKNLSAEKQWVKFSYVWLAAHGNPSPRPKSAKMRRVLSEPFPGAHGSRDLVLLLCEPDSVRRERIIPGSQGSRVHRGDLFEVRV